VLIKAITGIRWYGVHFRVKASVKLELEKSNWVESGYNVPSAAVSGTVMPRFLVRGADNPSELIVVAGVCGMGKFAACFVMIGH